MELGHVQRLIFLCSHIPFPTEENLFTLAFVVAVVIVFECFPERSLTTLEATPIGKIPIPMYSLSGNRTMCRSKVYGKWMRRAGHARSSLNYNAAWILIANVLCAYPPLLCLEFEPTKDEPNWTPPLQPILHLISIYAKDSFTRNDMHPNIPGVLRHPVLCECQTISSMGEAMRNSD